MLVQLIVLVQDLTQQRAAEEAQRRSQALIDAAVAALPVTLTTFDRSLRFTSVAGGLDQVGNQPEDFLGKHISEVTEDPHTLLALQNALAGTESTTRTLVSGQTYLTLHGPMKDGDGAVVGVVAVSSNVTVEVAAEAERRRAEQEALFLVRHDPLTGLPGRSALIEYLTAPAPAGQRPEPCCCSISTTSRSSTRVWDTGSVTRCSSRSPAGCRMHFPGRWSRGTAVTSSQS